MITMQTIDLSMTPEITVLPEVYCSQYDNGIRQVVFNLFEDAEQTTPYNVDGMTATVEGTKPDGRAFSYEAQASGSSVTVTIQTQMAAVAGIVPSEIVLTNDTDRVGSLNFLLMVEPAGILADADMSQTDLPGYIDLARENAATAVTAAEAATSAAAQAVPAAEAATSAAAQAVPAAGIAEQAKSDAEAWAVGKRNGEDVGPTDPAYHNNAKYWSGLSGTQKLNDLTDVSITQETLENGQVLTYDSPTGKWVNGEGGGGIHGTVPIEKGGTGNIYGYIQTGKRTGGTPGTGATIEGTNNAATGTCSHAEGSGVNALGDYSHAGGYGSTENPVEARRTAEFLHGNNAVNKADSLGLASSITAGGAFGVDLQTEIFDENRTIDIKNGGGLNGIITNAVTVTVKLEPMAVYMLLCDRFAKNTGVMQGFAGRLIFSPAIEAAPTLLAIGSSTPPLTIGTTTAREVTLQNTAATGSAQFSFIRFM